MWRLRAPMGTWSGLCQRLGLWTLWWLRLLNTVPMESSAGQIQAHCNPNTDADAKVEIKCTCRSTGSADIVASFCSVN
ncbi:hypothetical protein PF005_g11790 [Phytophthora fragariae]|uniref:Cyanovirin-N domain-containing protein n=2 Tax=Phytophthora TaxID=4783 RepID=A0A6A3LKD7_9STRA|nr:hypothetical protein PF003_g35658 [Phytophthora fragariae]KAE8989387.1 hypothetical protein PR002_g21463 [Phytophthora rubi]KAE8937522.1 hypothetical protein PF009_g12579 [Phytophthora fragariae]KAE8992423.1 hypothetical protein PR001_g20947 [Phytophthora rubi]KAE9019639.1 hypothetical protein PF011_g5743 [Phytophthora fragariae]